jgi:nicotinamidase-related amidase
MTGIIRPVDAEEGTPMKAAVIVIDRLNDVVHGARRCARAAHIIEPLRRLRAGAPAAGAPVIFANDGRRPEIDAEFKIWGPHAIAGTPAARVIAELAPHAGDYQVAKRRHSGFRGTDLALLLRDRGVDTLILCGLHPAICLRHTAADACDASHALIVATDAVEAFAVDEQRSGLDDQRRIDGAELVDSDALRWRPTAAAVPAPATNRTAAEGFLVRTTRPRSRAPPPRRATSVGGDAGMPMMGIRRRVGERHRGRRRRRAAAGFPDGKRRARRLSREEHRWLKRSNPGARGGAGSVPGARWRSAWIASSRRHSAGRGGSSPRSRGRGCRRSNCSSARARSSCGPSCRA